LEINFAINQWEGVLEKSEFSIQVSGSCRKNMKKQMKDFENETKNWKNGTVYFEKRNGND
jgi:hypothetical protein